MRQRSTASGQRGWNAQPLGGFDRAWHFPFHGRLQPDAGWVGHRRCGDQRFGVGVDRLGKQSLTRREFHNPPQIHDRKRCFDRTFRISA